MGHTPYSLRNESAGLPMMFRKVSRRWRKATQRKLLHSLRGFAGLRNSHWIYSLRNESTGFAEEAAIAL